MRSSFQRAVITRNAPSVAMDPGRRSVADRVALPPMRPTLGSSPTRPHVIVVSSTPDSVARAPPTRSFGDSFGQTPLVMDATESPFFQPSGEEAKAKSPAGLTERPERPAPYVPGELEQAVRRRRDWTPPPGTGDTAAVAHHIHSNSSANGETWSSSPNAAKTTKGGGNVFQALRDNYRYQTEDGVRPVAPPNQASGGTETCLTRRNPLEPVCLGDTVHPAATKEAIKALKTKKKPRTITELAVAAYADADPSLDSADDDVAAGILRTVSAAKRPLEPAGADETFTGLHERNLGLPNTRLRKLKKPATAKAKKATATTTTTATTGGARKPAAKRGQSKAGGGDKSTAVARRPPPRQPVLLSPRSALQESTAQDFLFGTSSQLMGDESPTFLRALQEAMQASNQAAADTEITTVDLTGATTPPLITTAAATSRARLANRLWAAGARGDDGRVTVDTVVDLEEEVEFPEDFDAVARALVRQERAAIAKSAGEPKTQADVQAQDADMTGAAAAPTVLDSPSPLAPPAPPSPTPAQPRVEVQEQPSQQTQPRIEEPPPSQRPNFEMLSTAQLSSKVASYGFKPMRVRKTMVALLEQCWDASAGGQAARAAVPATARSASTKAAAKKTTKSATKATKTTAKTTTKTTTTKTKVTATKATKAASKKKSPKKTASKIVLEVADSESDGEVAMADAASYASDASDASDGSDSSLSDAESARSDTSAGQSLAFEHITKAVLEAPRSKDPSQPSWHERMLMYDTIVLESFTAWLNEKGLPAAGYDVAGDGPVSATEVKRWCEMKSVCCTWQVNHRGKVRKL